ncbi:MAG: heparan-alpha-glucosaminide N-acetyltransferase domain-containing protein [Candidatus Kapaibacterium sp.]
MFVTMQDANPKNRIVFIDLMRAYAILMMVQGHLVDACLDPIYRDPNNLIYATWNFMRGMTAPVFFFSSGMIFTYLLMREEERSGKGFKNVRVKKGFARFTSLIFIGYLLHFNFWILWDLLDGSLEKSYHSMLIVDVLHIIGTALLLIVLMYILATYTRIKVYALLLIGALATFYYYPDIEPFDFSYLPDFLSNYLAKGKQFSFTIIPWVGYSLFGGVLGIFVWTRPKSINSYILAFIFLVLGFLLHFYSTEMLLDLYVFTDWINFKQLAFNNFLFYRLGHVFIVVSIFMVINNIFKNIPKIVPKIGSETLTIYIVHAFVIYGSIFQFGIAQNFSKALTPWECFALALTLEIFFVVLVYYIKPIRAYLWEVGYKLKLVTKPKS